MDCPVCGVENPDNAERCRGCGATLAESSAAPAASSLRLDQNLAAMLSYLLGWVTGLIFFNLEKENDFVRFHAMQSIVTFGGFFALAALFLVLSWIPVIGVIFWLFWVVGWLWVFIALVVWIVLMVRAYRGERYRLPWIGNFAERLL
jgi:uncharacterized membrane protein